jgi:hypothetical protein
MVTNRQYKQDSSVILAGVDFKKKNLEAIFYQFLTFVEFRLKFALAYLS